MLVAEIKSQGKKSKESHLIMMLVWETSLSCHPLYTSVFSTFFSSQSQEKLLKDVIILYDVVQLNGRTDGQ